MANQHRNYRKRTPREVHDPSEPALRRQPGPQASPVDEVDRGLYNNRPARARAEGIGAVLLRCVSAFEARMVQNVLLPNLIHRLEFEQRGRIPDMVKCLQYAPSDGRYIVQAAWMDNEGIGHVHLAWKETAVNISPTIAPGIPLEGNP